MNDYRYLITSYNDQLTTKAGAKPRFFVRTYGCQMNERESEKLAALLSLLGYDPAPGEDEADLILYNTCCVRESAEDKIWGHLSRLKRLKQEKPNLLIAVSGCMSQQEETAEIFRKKHKYVNLVFGTANRHRLPEFLWRVLEKNETVIDISGIEGDEVPEITEVSATTREFPHKAGVNIMYGCNNYCAYCIVPYVRGRERSRPAADILQEIESLANDGVKEIMLLGQNVNSYAYGFTELLEKANEIDGLKRIRFMTSHPKDCSDELITAMKTLPKICKSIHLPLQSGSTKILNDMNRNYTQQQYLTLAKKLTEAGIAISTDIIVGYPGETEEDFEATLDVVRTVRFSGVFTFIYSKRSGTPAAERTDTPNRKIINDRFDRLTSQIQPILQEINNKKIGLILEIMVEEPPKNGLYKGRTNDHALVHFTSPKTLTQGEITQIKITEAKTFYMIGETP